MTTIISLCSRCAGRYFRLELARELHRRARDIPFMGMVTSSIIAYLFHPYLGALKAAVWATVFLLIYSLTYWFLFRPSKRPNHWNFSIWMGRFVFFFGCFAVMWASFAFIAMPELDDWQRLALLLMFLGIVALPAPVFSLCMPIAVFHPTTMLLPSGLLAIYLHGRFDAHVLATLMVLGGGLGFVLKQIATTRRILRAVDDKRALASSMSTIEQLMNEKHVDPVTGLLNRAGLEVQMPNLAGRYCRVSAIKVDGIDDMYSLHGKGIADSIVWSVGHRLLNRKRPQALLAHTGLGEFLLATPCGRRRSSKEQAAQICELFESPFFTDLGDMSFRVSVGVAVSKKKAEGDNARVVSDAITAMREATGEPGNSYHEYDASLGSKLSQNFSIRSQLRNAILNKEFCLYLQPKVDLKNGLVQGAEALVRWQSPELGMVSPAEFIPVAESTGDIVPLGRWVLHEAARMVQCQDLPADFTIAVNLSSKQFSDPALLSQLKQIRKQLSGTSRDLELEITESMVMADSAEINRVLLKIKALGFRIALDDFGTGYSSLSYLTRLQADTLKLDKSFIDPIPNDEYHASFVASIIQMVKTLKLKLVAEGIESQEQYDWFCEHDCDEVQGYFLSRPQDFKTFLLSLNERNASTTRVSKPA